MNNAGNIICKNKTWQTDNIKAPNDSKCKEFPNIKENIEINIAVNATKYPIIEEMKIAQSFFEVLLTFYIKRVLSIFLDPILSAAENLVLHI